MARKAVAPCVGEGMVVSRVVLRAPDVVFFKGVVEASEGLAAVFAESGGDLTIAAPAEREARARRRCSTRSASSSGAVRGPT